MASTESKTDLASRKAETLEQTFGLGSSIEALPTALSAAICDFAKLSREMRCDDVSLSVDLAAGTLHFRCYRRAG